MDFVEGPDGQKYYSDRFYLHSCQRQTSGPQNIDDSPLFDGVGVINLLNLKAVVVGTYVMDPLWMIHAMPTLFSANIPSTKRVPVFVMHGQRNLTQILDRINLRQQKVEQLKIREDLKAHGCRKRSSPENVKFDGSKRQHEKISIGMSPMEHFEQLVEEELEDLDHYSEYSSSFLMEFENEKTLLPSLKNDISNLPRENLDERHKTSDPTTGIFSGSVYLARVRAHSSSGSRSNKQNQSKIHEPNVSVCIDDESDRKIVDTLITDGSAQNFKRKPFSATQSTRSRGVYHPKFWLLFEKSGSLVVIVSTSNLTRPTASIEGSWIQRFFPASSNQGSFKTENDFGYVLSDFLAAHNQALESSNFTLNEFFEMRCGFSSFEEFGGAFNFGQASVHLVATVPGMHKGVQDKHKITLYGTQRMAHICTVLEKPGDGSRPWLPTSLLSNKDRLILQPTSITKWDRLSLQDVAQNYMPFECGQENSYESLLSRVDLIWPTQEFVMKYTCRRKENFVEGPGHCLTLLHDKIQLNASMLEACGVSSRNSKVYQPNHLFLSSTIFNSFDMDVLACFKKFDSHLGTPHFKSYCRLLPTVTDLTEEDDDDENSCSENQSNVINLLDSPVKPNVKLTTEERFAWFLLTSSNMSPGAQGRAVSDQDCGFENDVFSYSNFELGVLFATRLQGLPTDRLYVNNRRTGDNDSSGVRRVHLPVPYDLRPDSYQEEHIDADAEFTATPYFHEIPAGTATMGNMLLTPIGKALSATMND